MTDNMTPQLTLDPTAAAAEAVPTLTLTPEAPEAPQVEEEKKIEPVEMDDKLLTDAEKKAVEDFSHKIDIRDTNMILQSSTARSGSSLSPFSSILISFSVSVIIVNFVASEPVPAVVGISTIGGNSPSISFPM